MPANLRLLGLLVGPFGYWTVTSGVITTEYSCFGLQKGGPHFLETAFG